MDCKLTQTELLAYHFGTIAAGTRADVEEHLLSCPTCLRSFLALKRELETGGASPRPSDEARVRLRSAVAAELRTRRPLRTETTWWRRPLAFGFAAAAGMATMIAVVSLRGELRHLAELSSQVSVEQPGR